MVLKCKITYMRGKKLLCALLAAVFAAVLTGCAVQEMSSLTAFAQPYCGQYECIYAKHGGKDILSDYREVVLHLEEDGTFTVTAVNKRGKKRQAGGKYVYDEQENTLVFSAKVMGKIRQKRAAVQDGAFVIEQKLAGKNLVLKFRMQ